MLPATTFWERNDLHTPWAGAGHDVIFMRKAIEPVDECRSDLDICTELTRRLGRPGYNDKTELEWPRELSREADRDDVWIHPADAGARGIVDGPPARVFNNSSFVEIAPAR